MLGVIDTGAAFMTDSPTFRFAPSPNGYLHLGHAYSALLNAALAQERHGRFLVRIEDIDTTRCTPERAEACLRDLQWLGLRWEEPVRFQSRHFDDYAAALTRLRTSGLLYPCFCTRNDVAAASTRQDPDGAPVYPGTCKHLGADTVAQRMAAHMPHCWRLDMERATARTDATALHYRRFNPHMGETAQVMAQPQRWGDAVLARKETPTSYHLSVVVDDALQGVTHVVRGEDLEAATCLHRLLQALLNLPCPDYYHHPLVKTPTGDKLSKSKGHEALQDLRAQGATPADIRRMLGLMAG